MSSWRGIRFDFLGTYAEAIKIQIGLSLLVSLTLGLAYPYWLYVRERFLIGASSCGTERFEFNAKARTYYGAFAIAAVIAVGVSAGALMLLHPPLQKLNAQHAAELGRSLGRVVVFFLLIVIGLVTARFVAQARIMNATFGSATVGGHELRCQL